MKMKKPIALLCATIMLMSSMTAFAAETPPPTTTITQDPGSKKTANCTVTARGAESSYNVTVPLNIALNRDDSGIVTGGGELTVTGDIAGDKKVQVTVNNNSSDFTMTQVGKADVVGGISLAKKAGGDVSGMVATWGTGIGSNTGDATVGVADSVTDANKIVFNINMSDKLKTAAGSWTGTLKFDIALVPVAKG